MDESWAPCLGLLAARWGGRRVSEDTKGAMLNMEWDRLAWWGEVGTVGWINGHGLF